jgi:dGTPase
MRAGVLKRSDIPPEFFKIGNTQSKRIDAMVKDVIYSSHAGGLKSIRMSRDMKRMTNAMRDFLYKYIYEGEVTKREFKKAKKILVDLYNYYLKHTEEAVREFPQRKERDRERIVCDFVAGMTDRFALMTYERLFLPQPWTVF